LRRQRGLSQKKAAADLGISPALLSHYENGIRECGLDFLLRIAEYYSVSCDYLLGKSDIKNPIVYEAEPEAMALDRVLKIAKVHSEQMYDILSSVSKIDSYRMMRALCDNAHKSESYRFGLDVADYRSLSLGVEGLLYSRLGEHGKEKKKLQPLASEAAEKMFADAEEELKKYK
jgi:transcriptional regulator with XRE-family HTH domain